MNSNDIYNELYKLLARKTHRKNTRFGTAWEGTADRDSATKLESHHSCLPFHHYLVFLPVFLHFISGGRPSSERLFPPSWVSVRHFWWEVSLSHSWRDPSWTQTDGTILGMYVWDMKIVQGETSFTVFYLIGAKKKN